MLTIKQQSSVCLKKGWCNSINYKPLLHHMFKFASRDVPLDVVLAYNKFTPEFILLEIAKNNKCGAFVDVISRKDLSPQFIEKLYDIYQQEESKSIIVEGMFAENNSTPTHILKELLTSSSRRVRVECAYRLKERGEEVG